MNRMNGGSNGSVSEDLTCLVRFNMFSKDEEINCVAVEVLSIITLRWPGHLERMTL